MVFRHHWGTGDRNQVSCMQVKHTSSLAWQVLTFIWINSFMTLMLLQNKLVRISNHLSSWNNVHTHVLSIWMASLYEMSCCFQICCLFQRAPGTYFALISAMKSWPTHNIRHVHLCQIKAWPAQGPPHQRIEWANWCGIWGRCKEISQEESWVSRNPEEARVEKADRKYVVGGTKQR